MNILRSASVHGAKHAGSSRRGQSGAASLLVVMLLFFVVSLAAAYAGRNLIFEQRTSVNQYRSTESFEAAEAGMEWAIAMLNGGVIDANCQPDNTSTESFRQRNILINPADGKITRRTGTGPGGYRWSACVFNGANWTCSCPTDGAAPALAAPAGTGSFPAFGVRFMQQLAKPGVVRVEVNGCTTYDSACVTRIAPGAAALCHGTACSMLALQSGLKLEPDAPLTVRGDVTGTELVVWTDEASATRSGVTINSGGAVTIANLTGGVVTASGVPGPPLSATILSGRPELSLLPVDDPECRQCTFASVFGLWPESYRQQPAVVRMNCTVACTAGTVRTTIAENPGRMLWLEGIGGLALDSDGDVGTAAAPVVLIVDGPVTSTAAGVVVNGLIYSPTVTLTSGTVRGAIVSPVNLTGSGSAQVIYDRAVLDLLHLTQGSFVRIPGSWRDYP